MAFYKKIFLKRWFGRLGNNFQQLLTGIAISLNNKIDFSSIDHEFFSPIDIKFKRNFLFKGFQFKGEIFYEYINYFEYISKNLNYLNDNYILPNLKIEKHQENYFDSNSMVIHIRLGDIYDNFYKEYVQNPISYYRKLFDLNYRSYFIIKDPLFNHKLIDQLKYEYKCNVISVNVHDSIKLLMNSTNLSTSGVGTFPIMAAFMSKKLKNFYFSDLYLNEHLNPDLLLYKNINLWKINVINPYAYWSPEKISHNKIHDGLIGDNFSKYENLIKK